MISISVPPGGIHSDDNELLPDDVPDVVQTPNLTQTRFISRPAAPAGRPWKVLIVDDDRDVRHVSALALRGLTVDDRPMELLFASNAAEARAILSVHDDIAVALVDVVMESMQAGLELICWIRSELSNWNVRLVVRTGEPGSAPEASVMANHELHDYLAKSETTARRLVSCVTGAIRAWRDQQTIRLQRSGLEKVLAAVDGLFTNRERDSFMDLVVRTAADLLEPRASAGWIVDALDHDGSRLEVRASVSDEPLETDAVSLHELERGRVTVRRDLLLFPLDLQTDDRLLLVLKRVVISPWECKLIELYGHAVSLSLRHRVTWETAFNSIQSALSEREVMLREIHHRVKNNLQITASLLSLQADRCTSDEARGAIVDSSARVRAMALVHQQLYSGADLANLSLDEFCRSLSNLLKASLAPEAVVNFEFEPVTVSIDQAIPCGLIVNELLTNSLKHGRDATGRVSITITLCENPAGIELTVRDTGPGLPAPVDTRPSRSLGLRMINALVRQLQGTVTSRNVPGACFTLQFPSMRAAP